MMGLPGCGMGGGGVSPLAGYAVGGVMPVMLHDFVTGLALGSPWSLTRASPATYVGADGLIMSAPVDQPRYDYSAGKRALLVEASATNLLPNSAQFDAASWAKTRASVLANAALAPDGTMTADKLVEDTSNNSHFAARTGTQIAGGTAMVASIFAKAAERRWFALVTADSANLFRTTYFDLQTGTLGLVSQGAAGHVAQIVAAGNGWYRCSVMQTQAAASGNFNFYPSVVSANGTTSYLGDGASGLYLWGAQLEVGAAVSSLIPTEAAAVTRAADLASVAVAAGSYDIRRVDAAGTTVTKGVAHPGGAMAIGAGSLYLLSLYPVGAL
ncbi:phage head spike fiber domain-containing protein [Rhodobacter capsulatus]|uniref:phage head spike fiber domain-containing protein n=1 Tax=Rhodobacter capsulatus TaxID=1061 RepID=UPI004024B4B7